MLNSNDWHDTHGQFLTQAQALLYKSEECLAHLELIGEDEDAIACLLATLDKLTALAAQACVPCIADFSRRLRALLAVNSPGTHLQRDALPTLKNCLTLMSWQLELIDPRTGEMPMDSAEQHDLLDRLAEICGTASSADCALE